MLKPQQRKIIHIDMDCFYAAIEIRDKPELAALPVAVGGKADRRGVLCTCNYIARKYGVKSAMPTAKALQLCPELVVLPVNMSKYKQVSRRIQAIFWQFTDQVEPLALDEAYLDVSDSKHCQGSATLIAKAICQQIWQQEHLTASAGIAENKLLAKIASGWNKPNGIWVIRPEESLAFITQLPIERLFGVGKVMASKLHNLNIKLCGDLQKFSQIELFKRFGKFGNTLYHQVRGIDTRLVEPNRVRRSLSVEETFLHDINNLAMLETVLAELFLRLTTRLNEVNSNLELKNVFVKIKYKNFKQTSAEASSSILNIDSFRSLLNICLQRYQAPVRLLGIGVSFKKAAESQHYNDLFNTSFEN